LVQFFSVCSSSRLSSLIDCIHFRQRRLDLTSMLLPVLSIALLLWHWSSLLPALLFTLEFSICYSTRIRLDLFFTEHCETLSMWCIDLICQLVTVLWSDSAHGIISCDVDLEFSRCRTNQSFHLISYPQFVGAVGFVNQSILQST